MITDYTNKTVVITGGSAGIGLETARLFGKSGANVVICGRNEDKLQKALKSLLEQGIRAISACCDVTNRNQVFEVADAAANAFGQIDIWVNNAGNTGGASLMRATEEFVCSQMEVNLYSVIWGAQAAFKYMQKTGGVIINASSFSAIMPSVSSAVYGAAKSGVTYLTKELAAELGPYNIRVVGYAPGPTNTAMMSEILARAGDQREARIQKMVRDIAIHRVGEPEDIAYLIAFLASDEVGYINGATVEISGGKFSAQNIPAAWDKTNSAVYDVN